MPGPPPQSPSELALRTPGMAASTSNAEIGRRLFLVEGTVKAYVSAILTRLGVKNRQAAIIAYEASLVDNAG